MSSRLKAADYIWTHKHSAYNLQAVELPIGKLNKYSDMIVAIADVCCVWCGSHNKLGCNQDCWDIDWELRKRPPLVIVSGTRNSPPKDIVTENDSD